MKTNSIAFLYDRVLTYTYPKYNFKPNNHTLEPPNTSSRPNFSLDVIMITIPWLETIILLMQITQEVSFVPAEHIWAMGVEHCSL